ncbi:MAG: hypothetical protein NVSMB29_08270 [Candidatus Dormibacteria bacterium]
MTDDFDDTERSLARHFEEIAAPAGMRRWQRVAAPRRRILRLAQAPSGRRPLALASAAALALGVGVVGGAVGLHGGPASLFSATGGSAGPSARTGAAMAFDGTGVVLFGGSDGRQSLGDTWRWDGSGWAQLHPAHAPPAREQALAVYDQHVQRLLLVGGWSAVPGPGPTPASGGPYLGMPCFTGVAVPGGTKVAPPPSGQLPALPGQAIPPQPSRGVPEPSALPLPANVNCSLRTSHDGEVWSWNGSDWSRRPSLDLSGGSVVAGVTTDATGRVVVDEVVPGRAIGAATSQMCPLPGGAGGLNPVGSGGTGQGTGTGSAGSTGPGQPATAAPGVLVRPPVGCGFPQTPPTHRVLTGDGESWAAVEAPGPGPGMGWYPTGSVVYDHASHQVVAFQGYFGCGPMPAIGAAGAAPALAPDAPADPSRPGAIAGMPPVRCLAAGASEAAPQACCGVTEYAVRDGRWQQVASVQAPPLQAVVGDPGRGLLGIGADGATYLWDGHRWGPKLRSPTPPARTGFATADDGHGHVLLFGGGQMGNGPQLLADLWSWNGSSWTRLAGVARQVTPPPTPPSESPCPVSGPLPRVTPSPSKSAAPATASSGPPVTGAPTKPPSAICGPGHVQPLIPPSLSSAGGGAQP